MNLGHLYFMEGDGSLIAYVGKRKMQAKHFTGYLLDATTHPLQYANTDWNSRRRVSATQHFPRSCDHVDHLFLGAVCRVEEAVNANPCDVIQAEMSWKRQV